MSGNGLELVLPRQLIQQTADPAFDFHWADNVQNLDSPYQFGVNGDSALNRRWNYRYEGIQRKIQRPAGTALPLVPANKPRKVPY